MGRWRALGARSKAAHAARAVHARRPAAGDGGRDRLRRRRAAGRAGAAWPQARFDGFELSPPAIEIARGRGIPRAGRLEAFDGARVPAEDGAYDLAVLSHVLEHVPDPAPLLAEAARVARHVLVEVPLEANRSAARPAKRAEAARIGHLHAFDRAAVPALVAGAGPGGRRRAERSAPARAPRLLRRGRRGPRRGGAKWAVRAAVWRIAPEGGEQWFTVHYAVLTGPSRAKSSAKPQDDGRRPVRMLACSRRS